MNEGKEYTRDELSKVLGEPFVRGLEMMGGRNKRIISMEIGDEIKGTSREEDEDAKPD